MADSPSIATDSPSSVSRRKQVQRRTTKACDTCRTRKIKCVYSNGTICDACADLGVQCTTNTPTRKRGPKARQPRARLGSLISERSEPVECALPVTNSPPSTSQLTIERLAPIPVIESIINDWFELIYSVCPILNRNTFLRRLSNGEANLNPTFAALVLSICAATVASLKRKRLFEYEYEHGDISPERCIHIAEELGFFNGRKNIDLERCQALYNFGVALGSVRGIDDEETFIYVCEASSGIKWLAYHRLRTMTQVEQELLKRTFWICFAGTCTSDLHGRPSLGLLTSQDSVALLTPAEITDAELDPSNIDCSGDWHGNKMSYIPGLNFLSKLYLLWYRSQQSGNNDTIAHLQYHTNLVRCALDWLPPELQWRGGLSRTRGNFGTDVQTANLFITQLHIRYNLLEQMKALSRSSRNDEDSRMTPPEIVDERQSIVDDMLEILTHMPQRVLESNGFSLLPKIRDIGSSLLEDRRAGKWQDVSTPGAQRNLEKLLEILRELDATDPSYLGTSPQTTTGSV